MSVQKSLWSEAVCCWRHSLTQCLVQVSRHEKVISVYNWWVSQYECPVISPSTPENQPFFFMSSWHWLWMAAFWTRVYRHNTDRKRKKNKRKKKTLHRLTFMNLKVKCRISVPLNRIVKIKIMTIIKVQAHWAQCEQQLSSEDISELFL